MARTPTTTSRLTHLIKHWPTDPIRPASVSVQTYLQSRLSSQPQDSSSSTNTAANAKTSAIPQSSLNALDSLLENRYAKRYPLSEKLRHPASNPDHYDNLLQEFEEAPNRDVIGRIRKRLGGLLRFK
ncbi:hypothetical protein BDW67DRAFT_149369 [Aspergillus spinulosporus]